MRKELLACIATLVIASVSILGVQQNVTMETYQKWKAENASRLSAAGTAPHYVLVGTSQYIGNGEAQIDFVLDGPGQDHTLIIQPLRVTKTASGQTETKKVGEISTTTMNGFGESEKANTLFATTLKAVTGPEANALEVKWKIGGKSQVEMINILTLGAQAETSVSSIMPAI